MKRKFDTVMGRFIYNKRIAIVEPVFGNLQNKGMRRFTLRGKKGRCAMEVIHPGAQYRENRTLSGELERKPESKYVCQPPSSRNEKTPRSFARHACRG